MEESRPTRRLRRSREVTHLGENFISFGLVAEPPNIHDCVNGRRSGNHEDYVKVIKLAVVSFVSIW